MSAKTEIEWTDATWNPTRGCSLVSPGCKNCYAMRIALARARSMLKLATGHAPPSIPGQRVCSGVGSRGFTGSGGESGPGARPAHPDWFRAIRDDCKIVGVPFFFKQWGDWQNGSAQATLRHRDRIVLNDGSVLAMSSEAPSLEQRNKWQELAAHTMSRVGKTAAGAVLDGREHREFPVTR